MCLIYIIMGTPQMLITMIPAGIIGELILSYSNGYHSIGKATLAYAIYSGIYGFHGAVMLWVFGRAYMEENFGTSFTSEGLDLISSLYYNPMWIVVIVLLGVILGALGCLFGYKLLKKHFIKLGAIKEVN